MSALVAYLGAMFLIGIIAATQEPKTARKRPRTRRARTCSR